MLETLEQIPSLSLRSETSEVGRLARNVAQTEAYAAVQKFRQFGTLETAALQKFASDQSKLRNDNACAGHQNKLRNDNAGAGHQNNLGNDSAFAGHQNKVGNDTAFPCRRDDFVIPTTGEFFAVAGHQNKEGNDTAVATQPDKTGAEQAGATQPNKRCRTARKLPGLEATSSAEGQLKRRASV